MITTAKWQCREVINIMVGYGVRDIVLCPGTRDTPLIMAAVRTPGLKDHDVVDERSAAFIAYGMCKLSRRPVAVVCTSGSAALNLTPAIAEAYYAHCPVIAVTADRPDEWIDRDDSQTIRQKGVMDNFVVKSVNVTCHCESADVRNAITTNLNVALAEATSIKCGPVHINVEVDEPIAEEVEMDSAIALKSRVIHIYNDHVLGPDAINDTVCLMSEKRKIMIVGGFDFPMTRVQRERLARFAERDNVVLLSEHVSNMKTGNAITMIDEALVAIRNDKTMFYPDLVVSFGGALVSRSLKEFIRESGAEHWMVGHHQMYPDCFSTLTKVFPDKEEFLKMLDSVSVCVSDYNKLWHNVADGNIVVRKRFMADAPWCDLSVIDRICREIPEGWNLQLSNGMTVRYALGVPVLTAATVHCNRGVSGIDGSLSTAVGASVACEGNTLLITGDMSAQYDMGALASTLIDSRLRIVVMNNGGGGIFRFIRTTCRLPELDAHIASRSNFPARALAEAFGFRFLQADDFDSLAEALELLFAPSDRPVMLLVNTSGKLSATIFHEYYKRFKNIY